MAKPRKSDEKEETKHVAEEEPKKKRGRKPKAALEVVENDDGEGDEGDEDEELPDNIFEKMGAGQGAANAAEQQPTATIAEPLKTTGRPVSTAMLRQRVAQATASERAAYLNQLSPAERSTLMVIPPDEVDGLEAIRTRADLQAAGFTFAVPQVVDTRGEKQLPLAAHADRLTDLAECRYIYTDIQLGVRVNLTQEEKQTQLERAAGHANTIRRLQQRVGELKAALQDLKRDIQAQERERDRAFALRDEGFEMRDCRTRYYLNDERMVVEAIEIRDGQIEISRPRWPRAEEDSKIERAARGPLFNETSLAERGEEPDPVEEGAKKEIAPLRARIVGFLDTGELDVTVIDEDAQEATAQGLATNYHKVPIRATAEVDREHGAQVLIGFEESDPKRPVILGKPLVKAPVAADVDNDPIH